METYVVLFIGDDDELGRTIGPVAGWDSAVAEGIALAEEQGKDTWTEDETMYFQENGKISVPGGTIHIGGLESAD